LGVQVPPALLRRPGKPFTGASWARSVFAGRIGSTILFRAASHYLETVMRTR
jgi:hypothetical protein